MSNTITVGFSNGGQSTHYVVDNNTLAAAMGGLPTLGSAFISQNVTGGVITDPYNIPASPFADGGNVDGAYTTSGSMSEAYKFSSSGWNAVKNITVKASGNDSILFIADNFVHADMDFSGVNNTVELRIYDGKRGNYWTGNGDDRIIMTTATNNADWSNLHKFDTGKGNDIVIIDRGDAGMIGSSIVSTVDGRFTTTETKLGEGDDVFMTNNNVATKDTVYGDKGNDTIFGGAGDDVLYGGEDRGAIVTFSDTLYKLLAKGDTLYGGAGADKFYYQSGDGFGVIGDGFDHIVDFEDQDILHMLLNPTDTVDTHVATVQTASGDLTGLMVTVNNQAAVFLENYTDETKVFV